MQNRFHGRQAAGSAGLLIFLIPGIIALQMIIAVIPAAARGSQAQIDKLIKDPTLPWHLEANEITYDEKTDEYTASGNVLIYKATIKLMADYIRFDHKNMKAYARGDVVLTNGEDILNGTSMEIDLVKQTGSVEDGYLYLKENNYQIAGDVIKKIGPSTYTIDKATITTCDGETPDWKITGKKVKIREDGQGTAQHAVLWARNVPMLYTPYFYYPARKKRQTGFLMPKGGTSDRWGIYYNQPFFWAISKSTDATFYTNYMDYRGVKYGTEFRYYLAEHSKGTWMADGFTDLKKDDGTGDSSKRWGFDDGDQDILRQNRSRYWLRGSHFQQLPADITAQLDVDLVSDQDYTRSFKGGYMGWQESKKYFEENFSRDLNDFNDPIRTNRLNFNKIWSSYSLNVQTRYNLDSTIRNSHADDTTLQQLPLINLDAIKQRISTSPFFYNLNSHYIYYWRREGDRTQRLNAHPRLYLPFNLRSYISIEPSVGLQGTVWRVDRKEFGPKDKKFYHRGLYDTKLDLFSEVHRVFRLQGKTLDAIKHTIRPQVIHEYTPKVDQKDLPNFDSIDRIAKKNLLTYSLTNTLTSKSRKKGSFGVSRRQDQDQSAVIDSLSDYSYNDFVRLALTQSYNFTKRNTKLFRRPFSPIRAKLDFFPGKYISVDADSLWSVYDWKFLSHNVALNLWDNRGDRLFVEYRYTDNSKEINLNSTDSVSTRLRLKITDRLTTFGEYEYNFKTYEQVHAGGGLSYKAQCWSIDTFLTKKPHNLEFSIQINLFGLGGFGI